MNINILFLLVVLTSLCSCSPLKEARFERARTKKVHSVLKKFKQDISEKGFWVAGIGEGLDHDTYKYNYLGITLDIENLPNIEFARKIEIDTLQMFLKYINSEEGIKIYLAEYPFSLKYVRIAFISRDRKHGLSSVANFEDEIYYCQDDSSKDFGPSKEIHSETYEEAVRILAASEEKTNETKEL